MRYKIEKEVTPERRIKKFLFFPRYCKKCKIGILWETVEFSISIVVYQSIGVDRSSDAYCPCCGSVLWRTKHYALQDKY